VDDEPAGRRDTVSAASRYASKVRSRARSKNATVASTMEDVLTDVADAVSNLDNVWPVLGEMWAFRQREIFRTNSHGRWAPLKASTMIRKQHEGATLDTLVSSGIMRGHLSSPVPRSQGQFFVVFGPPSGAGIEYAKFHLKGNGVPQRNPVPRLTGPERSEFIETIRDYYRPMDAPLQGRRDFPMTMRVGA
jgi:hypothetical protein